MRAAISFNGRARPVYWVNAKFCDAFDAYFAERVKLGHGVMAWRSQWRGLAQLGLVLLTNDGRPFMLTTRKTGAGNTSRSCESRTQVIRRLQAMRAKLRGFPEQIALAADSMARPSASLMCFRSWPAL